MRSLGRGAPAPRFALEVCKLLCQLPTSILHILAPPAVHPAQLPLGIEGEHDEMFVSP